MAQAINVLLDVDDKRYDINEMGLIDMTFNRFLGSTRSAASGILSDLTITMFDKTGSDLFSLLQGAQNKIRVLYGFDNNLSDPYSLDVIKFNSTYNNLGAMVSIGAIGTQINRKFKAETYPVGTPIKNILLNMAQRNNWYVGPEGSTEYIDIDIRLNKTVFKTDSQTDMQFIEKEIIPIANQSVINTTNTLQASFWDVQLVTVKDRLTLFFRRYTNRGTERRIWQYLYGTSADNAVISLTNTVDFSFLVRGLSIKVPITAVDALVVNENDLEADIKSIIENKFDSISEYIRENNLPEMNPNQFRWNVEVVPVEDTGTEKLETLILNEIKKIINAISTIQLEVIGNPKIMPTDLIQLTVNNKDGTPNIVSSFGSSYWRVITIQETIGLSGFSTRLQLVRESVNFI